MNLIQKLQSQNKKRILFVLHLGSGGTQKTVHDLIKNIHFKFDCYLLTSDTHMMRLSIFNGIEFKEIETYELKSNWIVENYYIEEYSEVYLKVLVKYSFDIVHIHHLIFHSFDLQKICQILSIPVILSVHDLYFICPAYTLMDGDLKYCHGNCSNSKSEKNCFIPIPGMTNIKLMKNYVNKWRKHIHEMFLYIDFFIMPSKFIKEIIQKNYSLPPDKIHIIEHGIDYNEPNQKLFEVPTISNPTKILFLGNLYLQKGVPVIRELYKLDDANHLEFHFLGFVPPELDEIGINHGTYENNQLLDYIKDIKPSFVGIFTMCGESYCYTLSEAWSLGIPVLVSKLGALEERVLENGGGWFIDINNMHESYKKILSIIKNIDDYYSKQNTIKNIPLTSTRFMSEKYLEIYDKQLKINID